MTTNTAAMTATRNFIEIVGPMNPIDIDGFHINDEPRFTHAPRVTRTRTHARKRGLDSGISMILMAFIVAFFMWIAMMMTKDNVVKSLSISTTSTGYEVELWGDTYAYSTQP